MKKERTIASLISILAIVLFCSVVSLHDGESGKNDGLVSTVDSSGLEDGSMWVLLHSSSDSLH